MGSKTKEVRLAQKAYWESKLKERLQDLAQKGVETQKAARDPQVRHLRAKLRETAARIEAIEAIERKNQEMAQKKAQKEAQPKKSPKAKKREAEEEKQALSKRQQKKQKKKQQKAKG